MKSVLHIRLLTCAKTNTVEVLDITDGIKHARLPRIAAHEISINKPGRLCTRKKGVKNIALRNVDITGISSTRGAITLPIMPKASDTIGIERIKPVTARSMVRYLPNYALAGLLRGQNFCVKLRAHKRLGSAIGPC
jgi:hypothetical protein